MEERREVWGCVEGGGGLGGGGGGGYGWGVGGGEVGVGWKGWGECAVSYYLLIGFGLLESSSGRSMCLCVVVMHGLS